MTLTVQRGLSLIFSHERRQKIVNDIVDFFATERNEQIGVIAAEALLDFMIESFGAAIYNKGVDDTFQFIKERLSAAEVDVNALIIK